MSYQDGLEEVAELCLDEVGKGLMNKGDQTVKIYRRLGKKRYLKGKYLYEHERIYVPIPSKFHDMIKPLLKQRLKMKIANQNDGLVITLHPAKTFPHAENTPGKSRFKTNKQRLLQC